MDINTSIIGGRIDIESNLLTKLMRFQNTIKRKIFTFFSMVTVVMVVKRLGGELGHVTPAGHQRYLLSIISAANGPLRRV